MIRVEKNFPKLCFVHLLNFSNTVLIHFIHLNGFFNYTHLHYQSYCCLYRSLDLLFLAFLPCQFLCSSEWLSAPSLTLVELYLGYASEEECGRQGMNRKVSEDPRITPSANICRKGLQSVNIF